jgi:acyclic terpene utilization AtuA family protein
MRRPVRIANASGFYGDRAAAMRQVMEGGPVDVVTGDYAPAAASTADERHAHTAIAVSTALPSVAAEEAPLITATSGAAARTVRAPLGLVPAEFAP